MFSWELTLRGVEKREGGGKERVQMILVYNYENQLEY